MNHEGHEGHEAGDYDRKAFVPFVSFVSFVVNSRFNQRFHNSRGLEFPLRPLRPFAAFPLPCFHSP